MMSQNPINAFPSIDGLIARYSARGLTNEQLSQNPILKDLSGNGHDIQLHNFAWSGMSGYGGYNYNFTSSDWISYTASNGSTVEFESSRINIVNKLVQSADIVYHGSSLNMKVRITGLTAAMTQYPKLRYIYVAFDNNPNTHLLQITSDGDYEIDLTSDDGGGYVFIVLYGLNLGEDWEFNAPVVIEQLPTYPGALVSDGVDDYGICENFPILTKEKGYTVVAVREHYDLRNNQVLCAKSPEVSQGEFVFDQIDNFGNFSGFNFGATISTNVPSADEDPFTYQTSNSWNGNPISIGDATIFNNDFYLFNIRNKGGYKSCVALYDLLIYDRDLTEEEINKLRDYFYQRDNEPLDSSLVDAWIFSGYKNEDAPDAIAGVKGTELTCYNFAWNEEGSGFKDGALWFDGVDDYLFNNEFPILTDYTIIVKRNIISLYNFAAVASKFVDGNTNGAFLFEINYNNWLSELPNSAFSFSNAKEKGHTEYKKDKVPDLISWQTKNSYNGYPIGSDNLTDGKCFSVGCLRSGINNSYIDGKIYWVALYSVSLTESEIQKEIQKLEKLWSNRLNN